MAFALEYYSKKELIFSKKVLSCFICKTAFLYPRF